MTRDQYVNSLVGAGWSILGDANYSQVFGKCDEDYVIKVGHSFESAWYVRFRRDMLAYGCMADGWLAYALWLKDRPLSPHFPKVVKLEIHDTFFVAHIEWLEEIDQQDECERERLRNVCLDAGCKLHRFDENVCLPASLLTAIEQIDREFSGRYRMDLHVKNAMVRPGNLPTLVIIDPLAGPC